MPAPTVRGIAATMVNGNDDDVRTIIDTLFARN